MSGLYIPRAGNRLHDLAKVATDHQIGFAIERGWIAVDDSEPGV